jgi:hypothetical protein
MTSNGIFERVEWVEGTSKEGNDHKMKKCILISLLLEFSSRLTTCGRAKSK